MANEVLVEFQKFLLSKRLVPEDKVSFYAYWASKFLHIMSKNRDNVSDIGANIKKFLGILEADAKVKDWQIAQAKKAVDLYINEYKGKTGLIVPTDAPVEPRVEFDISSILTKLRDAIRLKHYSYKTERTYIEWVKRFFRFLSGTKKADFSIENLGSDDVTDFLNYLAVKLNVSASTQNQAFNAVLFLFRVVLKRELAGLDKTVRAKRGHKVPVVLTVREVREFFKHVQGKELLVLEMLYGAGLRLMEAARLRIGDVDIESNTITVRSGKGDKDRTTILPERIKARLKLYLDSVKELHNKDLKSGHGEVHMPYALGRKYPNAAKDWLWQYVFPALNLSADPMSGTIRRHHMGEKSIQNAMRQAAKKAGIIKHATVHTLRHSFATHLLMDGVNIREIQELLGHKHVETTMIYTHVLRGMENAPKSPLDKLYGSKDKKNKDAVLLEVVGVTG